MINKVLNILYYVFIWLIFPLVFASPIFFFRPVSNLIINFLDLFPTSLIEENFLRENFWPAIYMLGIVFVLILNLVFKFTVKSKAKRFLIFVILIIVGWLTWDQKAHTW